MENGNEPINPCRIEGRQGCGGTPMVPTREVHGLTKREYFAALAMQGFCMWEAFTSEKAVAEASVRQADALLEELNKTR